MSYFSIPDFVKSGRKSLEDKNYWSALSVALLLPSMCSRIAFSNNEAKYKNFKWIDKSDPDKGKKYTDWKDKECYIDFCKQIMQVNQGEYDGWIICTLGEKFAEILYQLRCDLIHAGTAKIYDDEKGIYFVLGEMSTNREFKECRTIGIVDLCNTIFEYIDIWCKSTNAYNFKYTYVFDLENNNDDNILYNRLKERERADVLEENFIRENNQSN